MPISPYVQSLRARAGSARLLLPSVSAHVFDAAGRLLLVRQRDGGVWSTPGGLAGWPRTARGSEEAFVSSETA
jgi:hypothetical protein